MLGMGEKKDFLRAAAKEINDVEGPETIKEHGAKLV